MSQNTLAVRVASRTASPSGPQWWSLTLASEDVLADEIVSTVVAPLSAKISSRPVRRWYFDVSTRSQGGTVRLRVLACAKILADCHRDARDILDREPIPGLRCDEQACTNAQLSTEQRAFGGPEGLELAEEIFELSSAIALYARERFSSEPARCAFAALLLADTASATMCGRYATVWADRRNLEPADYWAMHARTCLADEHVTTDEEIVRYHQAFERRTARFHPIMGAVASEPDVVVFRKRWHRAVDLYLQRCYRLHIPRSAGQLAQQHAHLLLQRMGFTVKEEAVAGGYARTWTEPVILRGR